MKMLETTRLVLRHLQASDTDDLYVVCGNPDVMRYVGDGQPLSKEQVQKWIKKSQENYQKYGFGCAAIVLKHNNEFIGYCGLIAGDVDSEAEIIYALKEQYWGQGLAKEIAGATLDFGFDKCRLNRIVATIDPENRASIKIAEKLGMSYKDRRLDEYGLPEAVYSIERAKFIGG